MTEAALNDEMKTPLRLTADPNFIEMLHEAQQVLGPSSAPDLSSLVLPSLNALTDKKAPDVIAILTRFAAASENSHTDFHIDPRLYSKFNELFHQLSLSMPIGIPPLSWTEEDILLCGLTIYCETTIHRSRLKIVRP